MSTSKWKECPSYVKKWNKYIVDDTNPSIAKSKHHNCTIIGKENLPANAVTSWHIRLNKSENNDGHSIWVGVAPYIIDQNNDDNNKQCGWYFYCYDSTLYSGPPHNYIGNKVYGLRKGEGKVMHTGDSVGVVMDTTKGELSFALNGVSHGVAYEGIPLDRPLVPCVLLKKRKDSVELILSEVKDSVRSSVPVPNVEIESSAWDSITLTWGKVDDASFYQVETCANKHFYVATSNTFIVGGLIPETEYSFRVRTVGGSTVSEWSSVAKAATLKSPEFSGCAWRAYPNQADHLVKSFIDETNPRMVTNINSEVECCPIVGSAPLPLNKTVSWGIRVLKSKNNDGENISIGIAPCDLYNNYICFGKSGWYFDCWTSKLYSGPPHNYQGREYGPKRDPGGFISAGDIVSIVMDMAKGELSFALNKVNLGVAYEGIPLDEPLVPCVLLYNKGDSVELIISDDKEYKIDNTIPVPQNVTATCGNMWDTITLTWDPIEGVESYTIEVDGDDTWNVSTTNAYTKRGFFPGTEHSFRVRAIRGCLVSEWSDAVVEKTANEPFEQCTWEKSLVDAKGNMKYSFYMGSSAVTNNLDLECCTIVGNIPIPFNSIVSWYAIATRTENGHNFFVGVAPSNIDRNANVVNYGWYFNCYSSSLCSGPPHYYKERPYGLFKRGGQYVHTGDSVGVVMDTIKGELSFALDKVNLGAAYRRIPLDKPLVPCVILGNKGDTVGLEISEVKDVLDSSIPVPSNIITKSTCDTIAITWDAVDNASFYQIEVDNYEQLLSIATNRCIVSGLEYATGYNIRVRTVKWKSVSEWSGIVREFTQKALLENSEWKECPKTVNQDLKYCLQEENHRIASRAIDFNNKLCTVVGNVPLPLGSKTSWKIKILHSQYQDSFCIYIGVTQNDDSQNHGDAFSCGWYLNSYDLTLCSGPPHNYRSKKYGRGIVCVGDSIGVTMDTTSGFISYVVNKEDLGVAYKDVPLDKPLVPCVLLRENGDSVELITKENKADDESNDDKNKECIIS